MKVLGRTSGKWIDCEVIEVGNEIRFRVKGACGERTFDLTYGQLIEATECADLATATGEEILLLIKEAKNFDSRTQSR